MLVIDYLSVGIEAGVIPRKLANDIIKMQECDSPFRYLLVMEDECTVVTDQGEEYAVDFIPWQMLLKTEVVTDFGILETAELLFEELSFWGTDGETQEILAGLAEELNLFFS